LVALLGALGGLNDLRRVGVGGAVAGGLAVTSPALQEAMQLWAGVRPVTTEGAAVMVPEAWGRAKAPAMREDRMMMEYFILAVVGLGGFGSVIKVIWMLFGRVGGMESRQKRVREESLNKTSVM